MELHNVENMLPTAGTAAAFPGWTESRGSFEEDVVKAIERPQSPDNECVSARLQ